MSQKDIYEILKELGGEASVIEVRKRAKEKYPKRTLHMYVTNRLRKLQKWGYVNLISPADKVWKIIKDEYP